MRIGLVSDTHIPEAEKALPTEVLDALQGVDLILHAGDIYLTSVLDDLGRIAPVFAARGDDDYPSTLVDERVKQKQVLNLDGHTIWVIHELSKAFPQELQSPSSVPQQNVLPNPDIIIFGHEHQVTVRYSGNILLVNPGSPTFLHYNRGLGTVGILNLNSHEVRADIIRL